MLLSSVAKNSLTKSTGAAASCSLNVDPGPSTDVAKRVVGVLERAVVLVAHADVVRQVLVHFPVVIDEERPLGLGQLGERRHRLAGPRST